MSATRCYEVWKNKIPAARPFRVSAVMMSGKYTYMNFVNVSQFKTWLTKNYNRIHTIVSVK